MTKTLRMFVCLLIVFSFYPQASGKRYVYSYDAYRKVARKILDEKLKDYKKIYPQTFKVEFDLGKKRF